MLLRLLAAFQKIERTVETAECRGQIGAVLAVEALALIDMMQQLEGVADMLAGRLGRPRADRTVAAIEGAAPFGAMAEVHDSATIDGDKGQDPAARHCTPIDPGATVGNQAAGRRHAQIWHHRVMGATRSAVA